MIARIFAVGEIGLEQGAGEFALPPTRVEAMYAPDVFGEVPNAKVVVGN